MILNHIYNHHTCGYKYHSILARKIIITCSVLLFCSLSFPHVIAAKTIKSSAYSAYSAKERIRKTAIWHDGSCHGGGSPGQINSILASSLDKLNSNRSAAFLAAVQSVFAGATVDKQELSKAHSALYFTLSSAQLRQLDEWQLQALSSLALTYVYGNRTIGGQKGGQKDGHQPVSVDLYVRVRVHPPHKEGSLQLQPAFDPTTYRSIISYLPAIIPVPTKENESITHDISAAISNPQNRPNSPTGIFHSINRAGEGRKSGALSGKTVYLSAGHGFIYRLGDWRPQRASAYHLLEDFLTAEIVNYHLIPQLENAGATVITMRERDHNTTEVIVDNSDVGYAEFGTDASFLDSSMAAYGTPNLPMVDGDRPFTTGNNRLFAVDNSGGGEATYVQWTPTLPKSGHYQVYVSYSQFRTRPLDAHYRVLTPAGPIDVRQDQTRHGGTGVSLGRFYFGAGNHPDSGAVQLLSDAGTGSYLSADAVRFGGGMGQVNRGNGTSTRARWEEGARSHTQYLGAPTSVYDASSNDHNDDTLSRPRYAAWEHPAGEDAVYLSLHSNAPSPARGTASFVYGRNPPNTTMQFAGVLGSDLLAEAVHGEVIAAIRGEWQADWRDRGVYSAYFAEVNPAHNNEMPAMLLELAFHATQEDANSLREPKFRQLVAAAITRGMINYFASRDGIAPIYPPATPTHLWIEAKSADSVAVHWRQSNVDAAYGAANRYRIYVSEEGYAFRLAADIDATNTMVSLAGLAVDQPLWIRISAVNAAGESLLTETLAVRPTGYNSAVLLVNGFDRLDGATMVERNFSQFSLGVLDYGDIPHINDSSYTVQHGWSLAAANLGFDSASNEAVAEGDVALTNYGAVDWIVGQDSTEDEALSTPEQLLLASYLGGGGALLVSGSEIAWDLGHRGSVSDKAFLADYLGALFGADSANGYGVLAAADGSWPAHTFDDGSGESYRVGYPDVLIPATGATPYVYYAGGQIAGVKQEGAFRVVTLGFPLETINETFARDSLMAQSMTFLLEGWQRTLQNPLQGEGEGGSGNNSGNSGNSGHSSNGEPAGSSTGSSGTEEPLVERVYVGEKRVPERQGCGGCSSTLAATSFSGDTALLFLSMLGFAVVGRMRRSREYS